VFQGVAGCVLGVWHALCHDMFGGMSRGIGNWRQWERAGVFCPYLDLAVGWDWCSYGVVWVVV